MACLGWPRIPAWEGERRLAAVHDRWWGSAAHLEAVERLEADLLLAALQQVHHQLQVVLAGDVAVHDGEVVPVQQQLAQQLQRLALRHVVLRLEQLGVLGEEVVEVCLEELGDDGLVAREQVLQRRERVRADVERRALHVGEQLVEVVAADDLLGEKFVASRLAEHSAVMKRDLRLVVPTQQLEQDRRVLLQVDCHRGATGRCAAAQLTEQFDDAFTTLKVNNIELVHQIFQAIIQQNLISDITKNLIYASSF